MSVLTLKGNLGKDPELKAAHPGSSQLLVWLITEKEEKHRNRRVI